jgi:hypothetical protein
MLSPSPIINFAEHQRIAEFAFELLDDDLLVGGDPVLRPS